jgi:hypothetical protein
MRGDSLLTMMCMLNALASGEPTKPSRSQSTGPHTSSQFNNKLSGAATNSASTGATINPCACNHRRRHSNAE